MINIKEIPKDKATLLNEEAKSSYWSISIGFSIITLLITALCHWFFHVSWEIGWWIVGFWFFIFFLAKLLTSNRGQISPGAPTIIRRSKVIQTSYKGNNSITKLNLGQHVEITLTPEPIPAPYPSLHSFVIWSSLGVRYYQEDHRWKYDHHQLLGQEVEIEYLAHTGEVLSFQPPHLSENPLRKGERVAVNQRTIKLSRQNGHNESIPISDLDYIALYSHSQAKPNTDFFLNLRSFKAGGISVSSSAWHFHELEAWMARHLPDFDENHYQQIKLNVGELPQAVWIRKPIANARILRSPSSTWNLQKGLYLEDRDQWLTWGTFAQLSHMPGITRQVHRYPNPSVEGYTYLLDRPILFGIQLPVLSTDTPAWDIEKSFNPDWPVTSYQTDISLGNSGEVDFEILRNHFEHLFGSPREQSDSSDRDSLWISWSKHMCSIKLSTWKPYQLDHYRPGCYLEIHIEPDLSRFYESEYTKTLTLHPDLRYLLLEGTFTVPENYVDNPHTKYTPNCLKRLLKENEQFIVWTDAAHSLTGIGTHRFSTIVPQKEVKGLVLEGNYWRDQPTELRFYLSDKTHITKKMEYLGALNDSAHPINWTSVCEQLATFLPVPCQYEEHREYY